MPDKEKKLYCGFYLRPKTDVMLDKGSSKTGLNRSAIIERLIVKNLKDLINEYGDD